MKKKKRNERPLLQDWVHPEAYAPEPPERPKLALVESESDRSKTKNTEKNV